jgi:hypothetical protein
MFSMRPPRGILAALAAILVLGALVPAPVASAAPNVVLHVYDASGDRLNFQRFMDIETAGSKGWRNDVTYRPTNGTIVKQPALFNSGGDPAFTLGEPALGLSFAWRTQHTGYSTLFVDDGGGGFTAGGTVNLTYRAALDYRVKLADALARRPRFKPTQRFRALRNRADELIDAATASGSDATKGADGQQALDALAQAFEELLRSDGLRRTGGSDWWGVTVDRTNRYPQVVDSISDLVDGRKGQAYVRIVMDPGTPARRYDGIVRTAHREGVVVVGQLADSSAMKRYSVRQWKHRVRAFVSHFSGVHVWEIGNEVNGEWLGPRVAPKLDYAARYIKEKRPRDTTMLTFYWQMGTAARPQTSIFQWIHDNVSPSLERHVDVVALSMWIGDAPMGIAMDEVFHRLGELFPTQHLAIGELGYWSPGTTKAWWWRSKRDPTGSVRRALVRQMYLADLAFPRSVGGVFWWYYVQEMFPHSPLWKAMHAVVRQAHRH